MLMKSGIVINVNRYNKLLINYVDFKYNIFVREKWRHNDISFNFTCKLS